MARDFKNTKNAKLLDMNKKVSGNIVILPIDKLIENENNEYLFGMEEIEELANSINTNGFRGAIEVYDLENGYYEIASGHRRKRAMEFLNKTEIPATIIPKYQNEVERGEWLLDSNLKQRGGIKGFDVIHISRMICWYDKSIYPELKIINPNTPPKKETISKKFNISEGLIYKYMAISQYIEPIQQKIKNGLPFSPFYGLQNEEESIQEKVNEELEKILIRIGYEGVTSKVISELIKKVIENKDKKTEVVIITEDGPDSTILRKKQVKTFVNSCNKINAILKHQLSYEEKDEENVLKILINLSESINSEIDRINANKNIIL